MDRPSKTCPDCEKPFFPYTTIEKRCIPCAIIKGKASSARKWAAGTRKLKSKARARDRSYQLGKAQEAFNAYIRKRDEGLPCISCGNIGNKFTAGHYKSAGAYPELRFNEDNCHGQCWYNCNSNKSGNIIEYRKGLIEKIGIERVEYLEGPHEPANLSLADIIEIKNKYRDKLRGLNGLG